MSLPAVLQHLAVLETCGLISSEKIGRERICRVEPEGLRLVSQWINDRQIEWEQRLDRLGAYLETLQREGADDESSR